MRTVTPVLAALATALAGAGIASFIGLPAPALLGSTIAVTIATLLRAPMRVPDGLRNFAFAVIGGTLGAGVTPDFLSEVVHYPASLAALAVSIGLMMFISGLVLTAFFGLDRNTAILATSPGALSYTLALASEGKGEIRAVMVLQSVRLFLITLLLPPLLTLADPVTLASGAAAIATLTPVESILLVAGSLVGGFCLARMNAPAAWMLGGLFVSAAAHGFGVIEGRFPDPVTFCGFSVAGAVIGTRFGGLPFADLKRLGVAGAIATAVAVSVSAFVSFLFAAVSGIPFPQVLVAFAPGGVEGMSAMALALGYDPLYVAIHHIFRIILLIAGLPFLLRRRAGRA